MALGGSTQWTDAAGVTHVHCARHSYSERWASAKDKPKPCPDCGPEINAQSAEGGTMAGTGSSVTTRTDVVPVNTTNDKVNLLAAVSIEIQDLEGKRTEFCKDVNTRIKRLKKKQRDLATELSSGGQLSMFATMAKQIAAASPTADEDQEN